MMRYKQGLELGGLQIRCSTNYVGIFTCTNTADRTYTFPDKSGTVALLSDIGSGSGTVTNVSVASANGISGSVANPTTTPAITLALSDITPTKVTSSGPVTATQFNGSGAGLTSIPAANLIGSVPFDSMQALPTQGVSVGAMYGNAPWMWSVPGLQWDALAFLYPSKVETLSGSTWTTGTVNDEVKGLFLGGDLSGGGIAITSAVDAWRATWSGNFPYISSEGFFLQHSTHDNACTFKVEQSADGNTWTTIVTSSPFSSWPGHCVIPARFKTESKPYLRLTITRDHTNGNIVTVTSIKTLSSYGPRPRVFTWDVSKDVTFAAGVAATAFRGSGAGLTGTAPSLTVGKASNAYVPNTNIAIGNASGDGLTYASGLYYSAGLYVPDKITATGVISASSFAGSGAGLTGVNAATLSNLAINSGTKFGHIAYVGGDGVMEIGKHLDFHATADNATDYSVRLTAGVDTLQCSGEFLATSFSGAGTGLTGTASDLTVKYANSLTRLGMNSAIDLNTLGLGRWADYSSNTHWQNGPSGMSYGSVYNLGGDNTFSLALQLAADINHNSTSSTKDLWFRTSNNLGFQADWKRVIHSGNIATQTVAKADTLTTARTIALTGDVTGTATSFNGSANISIPVTISDAEISGKVLTGYAAGANTALAATDTILSAFGKTQGQINTKANLSGAAFTGAVTTPQISNNGSNSTLTLGNGAPLREGQSGSGYPFLAYNANASSTSNQYTYSVNDKAYMLDFGNAPGFRIRYAPSGTAGGVIPFTDLLTLSDSGTATFYRDITIQGTTYPSIGFYATGTADTRLLFRSGNNLRFRYDGTNEADLILSNDSRLTNSRPASDVSTWAKEATKPSYTFNEIGSGSISATTGTFSSYVSAGSVNVTGTLSNPGGIGSNGVRGLDLRGKTGSTYDFALINPTASATILAVPTGTSDLIATGNVGVGTVTTPASRLHIKGTGQLTAQYNTAGDNGNAILLESSAQAAGDGGAIIFSAAGYKYGLIKGLLTNGAGNGAGDISISTRAATTDSTLTERLHIYGVSGAFDFKSGTLATANATDSTSSTSAASIKTSGGISVAKAGFFGGNVNAPVGVFSSKVTSCSSVSNGTPDTDAFEVRELNRAGATLSAVGDGPAIGFHWQGRNYNHLVMNAAGTLHYMNATRTGWSDFQAGNIVANGQFNGSGAGLTGTASSLSVNYATTAESIQITDLIDPVPYDYSQSLGVCANKGYNNGSDCSYITVSSGGAKVDWQLLGPDVSNNGTWVFQSPNDSQSWSSYEIMHSGNIGSQSVANAATATTATNLSGGTINSAGAATGVSIYSQSTGDITITPSCNMYNSYIINCPVAGSGYTLSINNPTNVIKEGQTLNFVIINGATSLMSNIYWGSQYKFAGGIRAISTALNGKTVISAIWDGTYWLCTLAKDFS